MVKIIRKVAVEFSREVEIIGVLESRESRLLNILGSK